MEDSVSQEDAEGETFTVEFTPSQMYSLNTILRYNSINMKDPAYSHTSEILAKIIHETMVSENFNTAMENEVESFKEDNVADISQSMEGKPDINQVGHGVQ